MFESFDFQQMISAFIVLFAVIDIIGSIPIIINLKEKGKDVNAMKATVISFLLMFGLLIAGCSDNENEENELERSVSSSKREGSVMVVDDSVNRKKMKTMYDPELYLEAIEKASSEEAKMVERSGTPTK